MCHGNCKTDDEENLDTIYHPLIIRHYVFDHNYSHDRTHIIHSNKM